MLVVVNRLDFKDQVDAAFKDFSNLRAVTGKNPHGSGNQSICEMGEEFFFNQQLCLWSTLGELVCLYAMR